VTSVASPSTEVICAISVLSVMAALVKGSAGGPARTRLKADVSCSVYPAVLFQLDLSFLRSKETKLSYCLRPSVAYKPFAVGATFKSPAQITGLIASRFLRWASNATCQATFLSIFLAMISMCHPIWERYRYIPSILPQHWEHKCQSPNISQILMSQVYPWHHLHPVSALLMQYWHLNLG
jgi:hypothetical protein